MLLRLLCSDLIRSHRPAKVSLGRLFVTQCESSAKRPLLSWVQSAFADAKDVQNELRFRLEQGCFLHESGMKEGADIIAESLKNSLLHLKPPRSVYLLPMSSAVFVKVAETDRKLARKLVDASVPLAKWDARVEFEESLVSALRQTIPPIHDLYKLSCHPELFQSLVQLYQTLGKSVQSSDWENSKDLPHIFASLGIYASDLLIWGGRVNEISSFLSPVYEYFKTKPLDDILKAQLLSRLGVGLAAESNYEKSQAMFEDSLELLKNDKDSFLLPRTAQDMGSGYYKDAYVACQVLSFLGEKAIAEEKFEFAEKYFTFSLKGVETETLVQKNSDIHWKALQAKNLHGLARIYTHQRNPIISEGLYRNAIQRYEEAFSANDWRLLPVMRDFLGMLKASSKRSTAQLEKRIAQVTEFNEKSVHRN